MSASACASFDARSATLYLTDGAGRARNLLMPPDPSETLYAAHYHALNPYTAQSRRDFASARRLHVGGAKLGVEIVPEGCLLEREPRRKSCMRMFSVPMSFAGRV